MKPMNRTFVSPKSLPPPASWPQEVQRLFWDREPGAIKPRAHRAFVIQRILSSGGLGPLEWLRARASDEELRLHIEYREGREIEPRRLRYFELVFRLPRREVSVWIRRQRSLPLPGAAPGPRRRT